ncbi:MAG: 3'(2'),5'-bisphosphate nucleotidase CysQ, partial [Rhodobacteraceae bacterium]|nr:3'(2'),5'-bisphosphate nucleotidase CysQ [Paracoccaceae bacterium]
LRGAGGQMVEFSTHQEFRYGKAGFENSFFIAYAPTVELIEP